MSGKGHEREWIDRHVSVPVVAYDWAASNRDLLLGRDSGGFIDEWRKVTDEVKIRRGKQSVGSPIYNACEAALGLIDYVTKAGCAGAIEGNWCPSYEILSAIAEIHEAMHGTVNPMVQAVVRDAMDKVYTDERFGS